MESEKKEAIENQERIKSEFKFAIANMEGQKPHPEETPSTNCKCPDLNTITSCAGKHLPYPQLGFAKSPKLLQEKLKDTCLKGVKEDLIVFCEIFHKTKAGTKISCKPNYVEYKPEKGKNYIIFFTKNEYGCETHSFYVVVFLIRNAIPNDQCQELYNYIVQDFLPTENAMKKNRGNKVNNNCKCNLDKNTSFSYGCSATPTDKKVCKFSKLPKFSNGRQRFKLTKSGNDQKLEEMCNYIADITSDKAFCFVPQAAKNMQERLSKAPECQLGTKNHIFAGVTIIADYCAHEHRDENDFLYGTNAILSLEKTKTDNIPPKTQKEKNTKKITSQTKQNVLQLKNLSKLAEVSEKPELQLHYLPEYSLKSATVHGLAFNLGHGSICFENAGCELHATTPLTRCSASNPNRIGLISYLHKGINKPRHGEEYSEDNKEDLFMKFKKQKKENFELKALIAKLKNIVNPEN